MVLELLYPAHARSIPPAEYHDFFEKKHPLPGTTVFIARTIPQRRNDLWHRSLSFHPPRRRRAREVDPFKRGHGGFVNINYFVAQVLRISDNDHMAIAPGADMRKSIQRIWPTTPGGITWPPEEIVTRSGLVALSNVWMDHPNEAEKKASHPLS
jgi:hypothetical protein